MANICIMCGNNNTDGFAMRDNSGHVICNACLDESIQWQLHDRRIQDIKAVREKSKMLLGNLGIDSKDVSTTIGN
jgi:hypothetical protein